MTDCGGDPFIFIFYFFLFAEFDFPCCGTCRFLQADMLCNAVRLVVEFASFLMLKFRHPELERPYAVPCGRTGAVILCVRAAMIFPPRQVYT